MVVEGLVQGHTRAERKPICPLATANKSKFVCVFEQAAPAGLGLASGFPCQIPKRLNRLSEGRRA